MIYQNCKFRDPWCRGSDVRAWPYKSYSEYVLSSTLSIYSTLIAIVLRDYDAVFLYIGLIFIFFFYDRAFWQEVSVKSLILRWPLKHVGLLLKLNWETWLIVHLVICLWFCLFIWGLSFQSRIFHPYRRHHNRWRAANFDLCSAIMAIEQWGSLACNT